MRLQFLLSSSRIIYVIFVSIFQLLIILEVRRKINYIFLTLSFVLVIEKVLVIILEDKLLNYGQTKDINIPKK